MFPARLSFVTYNLWGTEHWPRREPALRLFFERYRPDVVCVQELTPETMSVIDDVLPTHDRVHEDFTGWTTEGNIWWNRALVGPVDHGAEEFDIKAYPNRRLFWMRLQLTDRPATLFVGNVHLSDPGLRSELEEGRHNRVSEVKAVLGSLGRLVREGEPAFLLGDFNDSLTPLTHLFVAGYESPWGRLHQLPPPTMPAFPDRLLGYGFASNFVLDWIVANRSARPLSVSSPHLYVDNVPPSDHWPIHAVYELAEG